MRPRKLSRTRIKSGRKATRRDEERRRHRVRVGEALMQIPARVHYACLAMLDLAAHGQAGKPVATGEIVARQAIPQPFLVQILQQLKAAGWVSSTRGPQGGYRLTVAPDSLTLLDVAQQIGWGEGAPSISGDPTAEQRVLGEAWEQAGETFRDQLARTRLSDLVGRCPQEGMFYI